MHEPGDEPDLARLVSESFIEDMDAVFREMGVSDPTVSKRMKTLYGSFAGREMHAAAELRMIGDNWHGEAEAAFSVERDYQDSGVGTELLGRVIVAARNRGVERLYMNCLSENRKMQRIAKKYAADLFFDHGEVVGQLKPSMPTPISLWTEAVDNSNGFVMAVLEFPLGRLRPAA